MEDCDIEMIRSQLKFVVYAKLPRRIHTTGRRCLCSVYKLIYMLARRPTAAGKIDLKKNYMCRIQKVD